MRVQTVIRKNTYYDSVTLMLISKDIKNIDGVNECLIGMGTDLNKELVENLNLATDDIRALSGNDFFIVIDSDVDGIIDTVETTVDELLSNTKSDDGDDDFSPATLDSAVKYQPETNMVIISVPGKYAKAEAMKALKKDLHVMLFSDNMPVEEEKELKEYAVANDLLLMGPDCGTAIINNVPLAFANVINKGPIGIVAASGTGTQEVSCLIHKLGHGVSQVIGTGGRDLKSEVGGLMMIHGIKALINDPATEVIVLISKPPAPEVAIKVLELVKTTDKPFVVNFIGGNPEDAVNAGAYAALSLEDTAYKAVALLEKKEVVDFDSFQMGEEAANKIIAEESAKLKEDQVYIRGLYTGGTLAEEAIKLITNELGEDVWSNIPLHPEYKLVDTSRSLEHTCIDLGDDEFTVGRPHPMIDPTTRTDRMVQECEGDVGVILFDVVLGYGSNEDPAGAMVPYIKEAKEKMAAMGKEMVFVGSICGTDADYQDAEESQRVLEEIGCIIMPSNAQAIRLAARILKANK
ncbi:MAG: acyl-CoA synthetase FdrA [Firmicutes bacterium]|jgi:succinyl-CoA synthetase alpha subunit|nr:acyl-CoA synthetase FdrA [Bacillota bacterium]